MLITEYTKTRRTFLKISAAALGLTVASASDGATRTQTSTNIRWAQGWLLWRDFKGQSRPLREALDDISSVGGDGIEYSPRAGELVKQNLTVESLRELLAQRKLSVSGNYFSAAFDDSNKRGEILREATEKIDALTRLGARNIIIGPPSGEGNAAERLQRIKRAAVALNEIGKIAADRGAEIGVHPHLNTLIETPAEIDQVMEATDPRYVHLSPDTGHIHLAGGDVVAILKKYRARLNYFHFKDGVRPFVRPRFEPNIRELGQGEVDFPGVMRLLKEIRYRGWVNVEQDATRLTPQQSCQINMSYVKEKLKPIYT